MSFTFHEETYRGCTIRIESDDSPESPREYDNLGTMVCFHSRYNLGDVQQQRGTGEEYLRGLVPGHVTQQFEARRDRVYNNCHTGYGRPKRLPSSVCDALYERIDKAEEAAAEKWLKENLVILDLYLYDHSGISMSTGPFSCPWDSGRVGFIYCTLEKAQENWCSKGSQGWDHIVYPEGGSDLTGKTLRECAEIVLRAEVETYDDFLTGQVAGFIAENPDGDTLDSCWGFYPDHGVPCSKEWDYPIGEARAAIDHWCDEQEAEAIERAHWEARDTVTVS